MIAPLGIVAGSGSLPVDLAARAATEQRPLFVIRIRGHADPALDHYRGSTLPIGRVGRAISSLKTVGCREAMFCGKVLRPTLAEMRPDWGGLRILATMLTGVWGRDDALNRAIATTFERSGVRIVGPADIWPDMLAPKGVLTQRAPSDSEWVDIRAAASSALAAGEKDIGQGAVARDGVTVAIEGRGHTDGMLRRTRGLPGLGGVLVKCAKPQQDRRIDLPVIGPDTVRLAAEAGLTGIAIEAGAAILAQREALIAAAEDARLFIIGLDIAALS